VFTALVAMATTLLFERFPRCATRVQPNDALKEQGRSIVGESRGFRRNGHPAGCTVARARRRSRPFHPDVLVACPSVSGSIRIDRSWT
jgi:hypothetical protein